MSASGSDILRASAGGSIQLLLLTGAGSSLAFKGILTSEVSCSLSKGVYQLFIPCLVFGSVLETSYNAINSIFNPSPMGSIQELWVPLFSAVLRLSLCALMAIPIVHLIARNKQEAVKRVIFLSLLQGNSNTMPLLVMQSLCTNFSPFHDQHLCYPRAMGYASLFMVVVNIVGWTILLQYIICAPDSTVSDSDEQSLLLPPGENDSSERQRSSQLTMKEGLVEAVKSPPFISAVSAFILSMLPNVPELLIHRDGLLRPLIDSTNLLGAVVVPISCMIVGSELYRSISNGPEQRAKEYQPEEKFGWFVMVFLVLIRMLFLPLCARFVYKILGIDKVIANPILGVFTLIQWAVPTANITVLMVSIAADNLPKIGEQLRHDISRCVFYQILVTPIFLTLNTALALKIEYKQ